ncbi:2'-5' RNA ligase family protein [Nocardioides yefusunii]|uniref:2'-5' RNA ligase family protein n=1 Tax=Nocardioides yefusunii TaxID=2500546 RepID=A0ABW1QVC2_9ACTN|nr:2'-5' RNA ligase family protein [Nocardioides yefusunii]
MSQHLTPRGAYPGHAVLQVPVPSMDRWVRERSAHYDAAYVSDDPHFVHAHVTALGPVPDVEQDEAGHGGVPGPLASLVAQVCADAAPFAAVFAEVATFPTGIVHLRPTDPRPFSALTDALRATLPHVLPYGGRFVPDPHLTLDALSEEVTEASTQASVAHLLPARVEVRHLDLAWWAPQECRLLARWELGTGRRMLG